MGRVMFRTMDIKEVTGVKDHGLIRLKGECSRCLGLGEISDRAWVGILIFDTCSYFSDKLQGTSYKISLGRSHTHTRSKKISSNFISVLQAKPISRLLKLSRGHQHSSSGKVI